MILMSFGYVMLHMMYQTMLYLKIKKRKKIDNVKGDKGY